MKKLTPALALAVFGFNCWFAWAMLTLLLDVRDAHNRVLPYFTNLCISLRSLLVVLPIVAAAYGLWLWFHKAEHGPAWGGFIVITMTVLILFVFPAMMMSYWLILDPSVSVALREPMARGR
jgi:hypothetical protein